MRVMNSLPMAANLSLGAVSQGPAPAPFEDLGVPVVKACILSRLVGPDPQGANTKVCLGFNQDLPLFPVQLDPQTGEVKQYNAPEGCLGPWALIAGLDGKVYVGTCEGSQPGSLLGLDPRQPGKGLVLLGRPSETETYL